MYVDTNELLFPWWLRHPHIQTILPSILPLHPTIHIEWERREIPDGDFLDLHWIRREHTAPIVIVLPGMESGVYSAYVQTMLHTLQASGFRAVVLSNRGAQTPNRLAKYYHAGHIEDLAWLIQDLKVTQPNALLFCIGFSLGGSILIRWLAEAGRHSGLTAAAAVSMTYCLASTARRACEGFNQFYQLRILKSFKRVARAKCFLKEYQIRATRLDNLRTIGEFDQEYTAPLNGFPSAAEYYRRCSSRQFLGDVAIPTLIISARDDPLIVIDTIPSPLELKSHVAYESLPYGGHLGFLTKHTSEFRYYYCDRIVKFFRQELEPR